ncbi:MAG: DUF503 domain-containing protein [bacterium]
MKIIEDDLSMLNVFPDNGDGRPVVGICSVELFIPNSNSLKSKRQVLRSIKDRIRHKFNVSIAEVSGMEMWQRATIGIACVSNDRHHANSILNKAIESMEENGHAVILNCNVEIL